MICLKCDGEDFEPKVQKIWQTFKGFDIRVESEAQTCKKCGWFTLSLDQIDAVIAKCKIEWVKKAKLLIEKYEQ